MADLDRTRIARRLGRGQSVELDWGLVIASPSQPGARGGGGSYRWTFHDPPIGEDGTRGRRVQRVARQLDDRAWQRIEADLRTLEATMLAQVTGNRLDATFDQVARHWLDPARHPNWSNDCAKKVQSVTTTWLLAETIMVDLSHASGRPRTVPLAQVPIGELTAAIAVEALSHVRMQRAHGTYRAAHECLTACTRRDQELVRETGSTPRSTPHLMAR